MLEKQSPPVFKSLSDLSGASKDGLKFHLAFPLATEISHAYFFIDTFRVAAPKTPSELETSQDTWHGRELCEGPPSCTLNDQ